MNGNMTMTEMIMFTTILPDTRDYYLSKLLEMKTILFLTCIVFLGIYKVIKKSKRTSTPPVDVDDYDDEDDDVDLNDVDYKALYEFLLLDSENTFNELERVRSELETLKKHKCPVSPPLVKKAVLNAQNKITITTYSDRSVVIRGNTKQLKEKLKELNCRWNPNLEGGPGWIASKRSLDKIKTELKQYM
jgi:hypothetical protein